MIRVGKVRNSMEVLRRLLCLVATNGQRFAVR